MLMANEMEACTKIRPILSLLIVVFIYRGCLDVQYRSHALLQMQWNIYAAVQERSDRTIIKLERVSRCGCALDS